MYCHKCGSQISDDALHCPYCGAGKLDFVKKQQPAADTAPVKEDQPYSDTAPVKEDQPYSDIAPVREDRPFPEQDSGRSGPSVTKAGVSPGRIVLIAACIVGVLLLAAAVAVVVVLVRKAPAAVESAAGEYAEYPDRQTNGSLSDLPMAESAQASSDRVSQEESRARAEQSEGGSRTSSSKEESKSKSEYSVVESGNEPASEREESPNQPDPVVEESPDEPAPFSITKEELKEQVDFIKECFYHPTDADVKVTVKRGTDGRDYSRNYYFHNGEFIFVVLYKGNEETRRLYFKDGHMIRFVDENRVTYDYGELEPFSDWEEWVLREAEQYKP